MSHIYSLTADHISPRHAPSIKITNAYIIPDMTTTTGTALAGPSTETSVATCTIKYFVDNHIVTLAIDQIDFIGRGAVLQFSSFSSLPPPVYTAIKTPIIISENGTKTIGYSEWNYSNLLIFCASLTPSDAFSNGVAYSIYPHVITYQTTS